MTSKEKLPSAPSPAEVMEALCACGHKKGMHWHRVMGAVECGECECRQFALPEPVSTEGAAEDRCEHQWGDTRDDTVQVCKACLATRTVAAPIAPATNVPNPLPEGYKLTEATKDCQRCKQLPTYKDSVGNSGHFVGPAFLYCLTASIAPAAVSETERDACEGCGEESDDLSEDQGMNLLCPVCIRLGIEEDENG